jgi:hypothetical protein
MSTESFISDYQRMTKPLPVPAIYRRRGSMAWRCRLAPGGKAEVRVKLVDGELVLDFIGSAEHGKGYGTAALTWLCVVPHTVQMPQCLPRRRDLNELGKSVFRLFCISSREEDRCVASLRSTPLASLAALGALPPDPRPLLSWEIAETGGQASDFRPAVAGVVGPTPRSGPEWSTGSPEFVFRTAPRLPVSFVAKLRSLLTSHIYRVH